MMSSKKNWQIAETDATIKEKEITYKIEEISSNDPLSFKRGQTDSQ